MRVKRTGARALAVALLAVGFLIPALPAPPVAASGGASAVISAAEAKLGDPWVFGAEGPNAFDCAGLVYYAFRVSGNLAAIGGTYRNASALYTYFRARGRASTAGGRPGDLVIFGGGEHVGIYLGNGRVISALLSGVRITSVAAVYPRFTAFLHTGLSGYAIAATIRPRLTSSRASPPKASRPVATPKADVDLGTAVDPDILLSEANLNLRARPTMMSPILGLAHDGAALHVSRSADGPGGTWFLVRTPKGTTGWVSGRWTRDPTPAEPTVHPGVFLV